MTVTGSTRRRYTCSPSQGSPTMRTQRTPRLAALGLVLLLASACTVRWVASYDEVIDQSATELQQQMDRHLTRMESARGAAIRYASSREFYDDYAVGIRSLRIRVQAHEDNQITLQQLDRIEASLAELRRQHEQANDLSSAYISTARELFNASWAAVIAWEVAKKRGGDDSD